MAPLVLDLAVFHHYDLIGVEDGAEAVRDGDGGFAFAEGI